MRFAIGTVAVLVLSFGAAEGAPYVHAAPQTRQLSKQVASLLSVNAPVVAITHATLIDGTGAPARTDQTVVFTAGKITAVGATSSVTVPAGAQVIDATGHTLTPGIVGLHDHMYYGSPVGGSMRPMLYSYPRLFLAGGVTTIRTTGSVDSYQELNIREAIAKGEQPGPEIHVTGPCLQGPGGGIGAMHPLKGPEDARRMVRYWAEEGVTWFKAYTTISRAELGAAIDEAHTAGIKVTAHLCSVGFREAVALGIDSLEHGLLTNSEYWPGKEPDKCPQATDLEIYGNLDVENGAAVNGQKVDDKPRQALLKKAMQFERRFVAAGGLLAAGSDPCCLSAIAGYADQRNFELLVEAGFTPEQAVQIMTSNGAKVLGIDQRVGTIAIGKQADLLVIKGDLSKDPTAIKQITTVFREGAGYDPERLLKTIRGLIGVR